MASYYLKGYTTPDGVNSRADVREWQNKLGVKADGIWGPNTQAAYERYANASSMSKFQEYYDTILGALNVPSISVSVPSKAELKEDISSYLRPGVDLAISKRRAAGETAKAELDADAVSRGMGRIDLCIQHEGEGGRRRAERHFNYGGAVYRDPCRAHCRRA